MPDGGAQPACHSERSEESLSDYAQRRSPAPVVYATVVGVAAGDSSVAPLSRSLSQPPRSRPSNGPPCRPPPRPKKNGPPNSPASIRSLSSAAALAEMLPAASSSSTHLRQRLLDRRVDGRRVRHPEVGREAGHEVVVGGGCVLLRRRRRRGRRRRGLLREDADSADRPDTEERDHRRAQSQHLQTPVHRVLSSNRTARFTRRSGSNAPVAG